MEPSELTDIEAEEMRKYRQQQFYNQIRGVRTMQFAFFLFGGMMAYQYSKKNQRLPLQGTELHSNILFRVRKHPKIIQ